MLCPPNVLRVDMTSSGKPGFLVLFFMIATISYGLPSGVASAELVTNGGFETGNCQGWIADRTARAAYDYVVTLTPSLFCLFLKCLQ